MEKKYKLTEESIVLLGTKLYRIEALKDFGNVKKGDKGGYVQSEENLSQEGDCWIYGNAKVCGDAKVYGNAKVSGNAQVFGNAEVYDNAQVFGSATVYWKTRVSGNAVVSDNATVFGNALVSDNAQVCDNAKVYNDAEVYGNALVFGYTKVYGNAQVCGNAKVSGSAQVSGNAEIENSSDYIVFKNWWSSGRYFTWTRSNNMWRVGCFYGTGEELIAKAYKDSEISGKQYERVVGYVKIILQDSK